VKQLSFSDAEYGGKRKQTRREVFLAEMERAVPWRQLEARASRRSTGMWR
jgi:IS5 family transposase